MSFGLGIITALAVTFIFKFSPQQEVLFVLNSILQVTAGSGIVLFIYFRYKLWQSKHKSTFSFLFNQNGFIQIINLMLIASGLFNFR